MYRRRRHTAAPQRTYALAKISRPPGALSRDQRMEDEKKKSESTGRARARTGIGGTPAASPALHRTDPSARKKPREKLTPRVGDGGPARSSAAR
jgi:hypothetical protein